jgi:hypothetical protein
MAKATFIADGITAHGRSKVRCTAGARRERTSDDGCSGARPLLARAPHASCDPPTARAPSYCGESAI